MRKGRYTIHILLFAATVVGSWQSYRILSAPSLDKWVEVPATVDEAKIDVHQGSGRRGRRGPTEHAVIRYSYLFMGEHYYGKEIWFSSLLKSKESEFEWVGILLEARNRDATVPCFVNPKRPSQAILSRERSPFALLGWLALALVGPGSLMIAMKRWGAFASESPNLLSEVGLPPKIKRPSASDFD